MRRHRFWPPSMIYISVIIITHISHITNHAGMVNSCSVSEQFRFQILSARQDRFFGPRNIHLGPLGLLSVGDFLIEWLSPGLMGDSFNFTSIWLHTKLCNFCTSTIGQIQYNFTWSGPITFALQLSAFSRKKCEQTIFDKGIFLACCVHQNTHTYAHMQAHACFFSQVRWKERSKGEEGAINLYNCLPSPPKAQMHGVTFK